MRNNNKHKQEAHTKNKKTNDQSGYAYLVALSARHLILAQKKKKKKKNMSKQSR
jgi:hypothetical protein